MVGKSRPATRSQAERMSLIGEQYFGCIPCLLRGISGRHATVQHVSEGRKRVGHDATYGACVWHHFGHAGFKRSVSSMVDSFGPSLALDKRGYEREFGDERLLVQVQDYLVTLWGERQWLPFELPMLAEQAARAEWNRLRAG